MAREPRKIAQARRKRVCLLAILLFPRAKPGSARVYHSPHNRVEATLRGRYLRFPLKPRRAHYFQGLEISLDHARLLQIGQ